MNVLITGVDGFVGGHLARLLLERGGATIYGMVRGYPTLSPVDPAVHLFDGDIADLSALRRIIQRVSPDKVYHLAGQAFVPHAMENPLGTFHINVNGVLNLLECVREDALLRRRTSLLMITSGEVYGEITAAMLPVHEDAPLRPANPYAVSKACADLIARQYRTAFGLDVTVARPFNHLGPGQSDLFAGSAFAKQIAEIKAGKREPKMLVGNLAPRRDFTDVRDVVRAYVRLLDLPEREPVYNVCSGRSVAIGDMLKGLLRIGGVHVEVATDPTRMRRQEIPDIVGDASRLKAATGWEPSIPIEQTLRDLLSYWEKRIGENS